MGKERVKKKVNIKSTTIITKNKEIDNVKVVVKIKKKIKK